MPAPKSFDISSLLTPDQIEKDLSMVGSLVIGMLSAETKTAVHDVAEGLLELAEGKVIVAEIDKLMADAKVNIPAVDMALFNMFLNIGVGAINLAVAKWGPQHAEVVAYVHAVAEGVLAAGF